MLIKRDVFMIFFAIITMMAYYGSAATLNVEKSILPILFFAAFVHCFVFNKVFHKKKTHWLKPLSIFLLTYASYSLLMVVYPFDGNLSLERLVGAFMAMGLSFLILPAFWQLFLLVLLPMYVGFYFPVYLEKSKKKNS